MVKGVSKMESCKCPTCFYLLTRHKFGTVRTECRCGHPDKRFIDEFFESHKLQKEPGFICFRHPGEFPLKRTPKWCPRKRSAEEGKE